MKCWFELFKKQRISLRCEQCDKEFSVARSIYKNGPKFCSKVCKDDFERDYVSRICRNCRNEFQLPRSDINRGRGLFCSRECVKVYVGESSIEEKVRIELERLKEPFVQEKKFGRYYADFYLPKRELIVECDGEYWHRIPKGKMRDQRKDNFLKQQGLKIVRITEAEIRAPLFNVSQFL